MTTGSNIAAHANFSPVPMLDVKRQNAPLRAEIDAAMSKVIESGAFVHGPACQEFEAAMAQYCGTKHAIGCASGSDSLLLALLALGVGEGDEVIVPSFTFFASASAIWRLGATPVFADILPETFNLDPADVAQKMTPATKAVMPVHLFGQTVDMDGLSQVIGDLPLVEDAAQAVGAQYRGKKAGALGTMGCFSFYPTKNLGGFGDGGIVTTDDDQLAEKLRVLRDHGQQPRYYHHVVGVNSRLDALQAAVLGVKLQHLDSWAKGRRENAASYNQEFARLGVDRLVDIPQVAEDCSPVWNQYTIRVSDGRRDELQKFLAERKIGSAIYYPVPLHLQKCYAALGYKKGSLPVTEQASLEVISLPIFAELTQTEHAQTIASIAEFLGIDTASTDSSQAA